MPLKLIEDLGRFVKPGTTSLKRYGRYACSHCNKEVTLCTYDVNAGRTNSCGCMERKKHGRSGTRLYAIWSDMKHRCNDLSNHNYGGKGITYDPKWETFEGFVEDMEEGYANNLEIDRIDSSKNYCRDNCQWITRGENAGKDLRKLTDEEVLEIRKAIKEGTLSRAKLGEKYRVSKNAIQQIAEYKTYKNVKD